MRETIKIEKELRVIGQYPVSGGSTEGTPMYDLPITPKENYARFVQKASCPMWTPGGSDIVQILPNMIPDNVARGMVADTIPFDNISQAGGKDFFGVDWVYVPQARGSMVVPGNPKVPDIENWDKYVTIPDLDSLDWEGASKRLEPIYSTNRVNLTTVFTGLFERLISFLDFENAAVALIDEDQQAAVHRLFDKLCIFYDDLFFRLRKYFKIDVISFHDDWGSQRAEFFSLGTCREMIVPYLKRVVQSAHNNGMFLDLHCCGANERLVPAMIEAGIDLWSGQNLNDWRSLAQTYEGKIIFHISWGYYDPAGLSKPEFVDEAVKLWQEMNTSESVLIEPTRGYIKGINDAYFLEVYKMSRKKYAEQA